jgi:hypothetical protein
MKFSNEFFRFGFPGEFHAFFVGAPFGFRGCFVVVPDLLFYVQRLFL